MYGDRIDIIEILTLSMCKVRMYSLLMPFVPSIHDKNASDDEPSGVYDRSVLHPSFDLYDGGTAPLDDIRTMELAAAGSERHLRLLSRRRLHAITAKK